MSWVLIAVACGAIIYAARMVMEYIAFEHETLPAIDRLDDQSEKLLKEVAWEAGEKGKLKDNLQRQRGTVEEMQARATKTKAELEAEQTLFRRLELEVNRKELKQRKKVKVLVG